MINKKFCFKGNTLILKNKVLEFSMMKKGINYTKDTMEMINLMDGARHQNMLESFEKVYMMVMVYTKLIIFIMKDSLEKVVLDQLEF